MHKSTRHPRQYAQATRWLFTTILLCAAVLAITEAGLAQVPTIDQWNKVAQGQSGWHAVPLVSGSANKPSASRPSAQRQGPMPNAAGGSVQSTYEFAPWESSENTKFLWFGEHMCCALDAGDIKPTRFDLTNSCTDTGWMGAALYRSQDEIDSWEAYWTTRHPETPPFSGVDWWWGGWISPRSPIKETVVCNIVASRNGSQVASIVLTWNPTPESNLGPPDKDSDCSGGCPIDFTSGNTYIGQTDIDLPGLNGGLKIVRTWNSLSGFAGPGNNGVFGNSWSSNYEERVEVEDGGQVKYRRGDGSVWVFQLDTSSGQSGVFRMSSPANRVATLLAGPLNWTINFQNGERRFFDNTTGWMNAFQDRNGNTTSITHDSLGRITKVTDPASRHLYFHYTNNGLPQQVQSITSDAGVTISYGYYSFATLDYIMLNQVTYPDGSIIEYEYATYSALIMNVWHRDSSQSPRVLVEAHTYDLQRRGLTSARAGDVEKLTVSYPTDHLKYTKGSQK